MTIEQIKQANQNAGHHWFEPGSMRFFNSRFSSVVHHGPGGVFFVSSERQDHEHPRLYTVRQALKSGAITTEGEFQAYQSMSGAQGAAAKLARQGG